MDKREVRRILRSRIAEIPAERRALASREIFAEIATLPAFCEAQVVALYAALPDEPQSREFIAEWHSHKRIVLPRVEGEVMHFYPYSPEAISTGSFGIDEPQGTTPCSPCDIDLMVVPGLGFTPDGKRMGRGKGFYDKYLSQPGFRAVTVGVCLREQLLDTLPIDPHDYTIDHIVSR